MRSRARSSAAGTTRKLEELTEEGVDGEGEGGEDIRSDIQEGGSEVARTVAIHTIGVVSKYLHALQFDRSDMLVAGT